MTALEERVVRLERIVDELKEAISHRSPQWSDPPQTAVNEAYWEQREAELAQIAPSEPIDWTAVVSADRDSR